MTTPTLPQIPAITGISDPGLAKILQAMKDIVEIRSGQRNSTAGRFSTAEETASASAASAAATAAAAAEAAIKGSGRLLRITRYTSGSGTWTKPSDTVSVLIRTIAGGGGGGGGLSGAAVSGGGGAAGGFAELYIASAASSYAYAVGAGGASVAQAVDGNDGSATTIAGIAGGGGLGGKLAVVSPGAAGGLGAAPTGGTINIAGGNGMVGDFNAAWSGAGGNPYFGGGGAAPVPYSATAGLPTVAGIGGGGCGGGGGTVGGGAQGHGGAGGAGYIEISEYS